MKTNPLHFLFLVMFALAGCSTATPGNKNKDDKTSDIDKSPETMLVSYQVKAGKEAEFKTVLAETWKIYRRDKLVFASPHFVLRKQDDGGPLSFVESFTWVTHDAPDHAPADVKAIWKQMEFLCEPRDGKKGIDGDEVKTVLAN